MLRKMKSWAQLKADSCNIVSFQSLLSSLYEIFVEHTCVLVTCQCYCSLFHDSKNHMFDTKAHHS